MVFMLIYDQKREEHQILKTQSKDAVAFCSANDKLDIEAVTNIKETKKYMEKHELLDVAFGEVTMLQGIDIVKKLRCNYDNIELCLIADASISPMTYMTPDIRAASLLLRPFTADQSRQIINQFFQSMYRRRNIQNEVEKVLILKNRQGEIKIPYSKIYYLEVQGRKIYIRLKDKEYSQYETMENMLKILPEEFLRCHRSFVINRNYITRVKLSENTIYLEDKIMVPLSRRYKAEIKNYLKSISQKED